MRQAPNRPPHGRPWIKLKEAEEMHTNILFGGDMQNFVKKNINNHIHQAKLVLGGGMRIFVQRFCMNIKRSQDQ